MRYAPRLLVALSLAASMSLIAPTGAHAVGPYGGGEVSGTVNVTPGILVTSNSKIENSGCQEQDFTFSSVVLNGVISDSVKNAAGQITTNNVFGGSTGVECADVGVGTVNSSGTQATFTGSGVGGTFYGTYERHGTHVIVKLTARVCLGTFNAQNLTCVGTNYNNVAITLDASEFVPIVGTDGRVRTANFSGEFHVGLPA